MDDDGLEHLFPLLAVLGVGAVMGIVIGGLFIYY